MTLFKFDYIINDCFQNFRFIIFDFLYHRIFNKNIIVFVTFKTLFNFAFSIVQNYFIFSFIYHYFVDDAIVFLILNIKNSFLISLFF